MHSFTTRATNATSQRRTYLWVHQMITVNNRVNIWWINGVSLIRVYREFGWIEGGGDVTTCDGRGGSLPRRSIRHVAAAPVAHRPTCGTIHHLTTRVGVRGVRVGDKG